MTLSRKFQKPSNSTVPLFETGVGGRRIEMPGNRCPARRWRVLDRVSVRVVDTPTKGLGARFTRRTLPEPVDPPAPVEPEIRRERPSVAP